MVGLRWPLMLMIAAAVLSAILIAIVIWNPTHVSGSYGSISVAP